MRRYRAVSRQDRGQFDCITFSAVTLLCPRPVVKIDSWVTCRPRLLRPPKGSAMRCSLLLIVSLLVTPVNHWAQSSEVAQASADVVPGAPEDDLPRAKPSYLIELVEFRFSEPPAATLSAEAVLQRLNQAAEEDSGVEVLQTFHLSAVVGQESRVQVERLTAITTGLTQSPIPSRAGQVQAPPIRSLQQVELGTSLTLKVLPAGEKLSVEVRYAASRIEGERPEDGPPDIVSFTIESQLSAVSGQQLLLGGANGGASSSYAALTVTEQ
jgi:hypothetical protein